MFYLFVQVALIELALSIRSQKCLSFNQVIAFFDLEETFMRLR